jgi:flagellin-like hook-associated protein FlgL
MMIGSMSSSMLQSILDMRTQLDDLQRQLGTGEKSSDYAGLGLSRGISLSLHGQLTAAASYDSTMANVGLRLSLAQSALTGIDTIAHNVKNAALQSAYAIDQTGQTSDQKTALGQLDQLLALLNTQAGDRYLFSGKAVDQPAVETTDHILNGNGLLAGLKQIISERNQADLGSNGLGRLVVPATSTSPARLAGSGATLTPDAPAVMPGTANIAALVSAGGTLVINGINVVIGAGANAAGILSTINTPATVALTGVTATLDANNKLVLTSVNAATAVAVGGASTAGLLTELGLGAVTANPTNLLTQGAVAGGQTLTFTVGANPMLTVAFGNGPGQVASIAQLNAKLATLVGGTATANPFNGNITVTAANAVDTVTVGGTATALNFGLAAAVATPTVGTRVLVSEDVAGSVFGFKLASVSSGLTGAAATGPAGVPPAIAIDLSGGNPNNGDTITLRFNLPDGSSENIKLTATTFLTPGANEFTIGATPAITASNLQTALTTSIGKLAATSLAAASTLAASNNFFNTNGTQPPLRVGGPPFNTATTLVNGTAANTVMWYTGDDGSDPPRPTSTARIDPTLMVSYGMRANEQALRLAVQNIAAFAAASYSNVNPNAGESYAALKQRVATALIGAPGQQKITDIEVEIAAAQTTFDTTQKRHRQTSNTLTDLLQSIEGVKPEQVGAQILSMQTSLQASLQTTAMLSKMSLVNYLPV